MVVADCLLTEDPDTACAALALVQGAYEYAAAKSAA
jgi:hypothetical protein